MIASSGKVYLVGAGPGDPELITVRGLRLLRSADVVIHDRLIAVELLDECADDAEVIDVGKYPDHHRISQDEINTLLVKRASQGKTVVRLKGGDPYVFGRGQEELVYCRTAGVDCSIVPGISSCIAGPAAAGVPVTSRGVARSFAIVTGQTDPNLGSHRHDFGALTKMDTVVFMMGRKNLAVLVKHLVEAGKDEKTPVTCIERATMKDQRVVSGTLATIVKAVEEEGLKSPVVTVVGDVAAFADERLVDPYATGIELPQLPERLKNEARSTFQALGTKSAEVVTVVAK